MSIETEKVALPLWLLILVGVVAVTIMMAVWYYWIDEQNVKMIGIVGGVVSGRVVAILTSATTVRLVQKVDYYNQMGIKAVLRNRHDKEYYRSLISRAKKDVRVMGSCTQFIQHSLDVKSDDKVLVEALRINTALRVRLLIPDEQHMAENAKARSQALDEPIKLLKRELKADLK